MYDLKKRAYFTNLGELRMLLNTMPDDTEVCACGADSPYIHFSKEKNLISIDYSDLNEYDCYEELMNDEEELYVQRQIEEDKEHDRRIEWLDEGTKYMVVGNKLLRTFLTDDGSWDYELYDISLSIVDSGQIGENRNLTREGAVFQVLSWNKLNEKMRFFISPLPEACEAFESSTGDKQSA